MASVNPDPTKDGLRPLKTHWSSGGKLFCGTSPMAGRGPQLRKPNLTKDPKAVTCNSCLRKVAGQDFYNYNPKEKNRKRATPKQIREYILPKGTSSRRARASFVGAIMKREEGYVR